MYPKVLKDIINDLTKLPSIGEKTAERLALFLATQNSKENNLNFSKHLEDLVNNIKFCKICNMLSDHDICLICNNQARDHKTIMVVADAKDVFSLEKMNTYSGLYHVLGGLIDFSRGITDKDLNIDTLLKRVNNIEELILATNGTVEGEMTAKYLYEILKDKDILITRLAYGLPVGADLKYADELTLIKAVENRKKL